MTLYAVQQAKTDGAFYSRSYSSYGGNYTHLRQNKHRQYTVEPYDECKQAATWKTHEAAQRKADWLSENGSPWNVVKLGPTDDDLERCVRDAARDLLAALKEIQASHATPRGQRTGHRPTTHICAEAIAKAEGK